MPKVAGEHVSYVFTMNPNFDVESFKRLHHTPAHSLTPSQTLQQQTNNGNGIEKDLTLLDKNKQLTEEIERLKNQVESLSSKSTENVGTLTSPFPNVDHIEKKKNIIQPNLVTNSAGCLIDYSG